MTSILRKIRNVWLFPKWLYAQNSTMFFEKKIRFAKILARLYGANNELKQRALHNNLGALYTKPHPFASFAYASFINQNPNHLGHWSDVRPQEATLNFEYESVHAMIELYHGSHTNLTGYITSGGTEGNIYMTWLGKAYLQNTNQKDNFSMLITSLTHYSLHKAARICGIPYATVGLNKKTWAMDIDSYKKTVGRLYLAGTKKILVPMTLGYTATGTCDDIHEISRITTMLQKEMRGLKIFLWIDAAMHGLVAPFTSDFRPFDKNIQGIIVDFHKFGQTPYPTGMILYRKNLKKLIERPIDYLQEKDATLLGSRPGSSAVAIWSMIRFLGKNGYKMIVKKQLLNKQFLIKQIQTMLPDTQIITHPNSLSCGLIFHSLKNGALPKNIEEKYWLYARKFSIQFHATLPTKVKIYKCFFLPHVTKKVIEQFLADLKKNIAPVSQ